MAFDRLRDGSTSELLEFVDRVLRDDLVGLVAASFRGVADQELYEAWQVLLCRLWRTECTAARFNDFDHLRAFAFKCVRQACRVEIMRRRLAWARGREGCDVVHSIYENGVLEGQAARDGDARDTESEPAETMLGPSRNILGDLVVKLSPRQRDAVLMMVGQELDRTEAARIMGCEPQAASVAKNKGVHRLRELAAREGLVA